MIVFILQNKLTYKNIIYNIYKNVKLLKSKIRKI